MNDSQHGWTFGYILLAGLYVLAGISLWGHVTEDTSFGFKEVIDDIGKLLIFWAGWKFRDAMTKSNG